MSDNLLGYLYKRVKKGGKAGKVIQVMGTRLMVAMDEPKFREDPRGKNRKKIEIAEFWDVSEVELE